MNLQETKDPTAVLWYEEIQSAINLANAQAEEGKQCKDANNEGM